MKMSENITDLFLSIVIPLYNEEASLNELHSQIVKVMNNMDKDFEIIFIDDGSTDNSFRTLEKLYTINSNIKVYQFRKNLGKSAALDFGFQKARGQYIVTMDADLQDDPKEIPALINKLEEGYHMVSGWKKVRYDPFIKKHTSKIYNFTTSKVAGIRLHDFNCGLKIYKREVVKNIRIYGQMHRYIPVLAHWKGYKVTEIPVKHHARKYGVTKFGPSRFIAGMLDLITVSFLNRYNKRPLHLFGTIGISSFLIGMGICLYLAIYWIFIKSSLSNRPILFLGILLIIVGVQFISLGLLGEMITESKKVHTEYLIDNSLE